MNLNKFEDRIISIFTYFDFRVQFSGVQNYFFCPYYESLGHYLSEK